MDIRPHHGLCIQFFQGKGYDDKFTAHMWEVVDELSHDPAIRLTVAEDEICTYCPNNKNHCCNTPDKVLGYDKKVLSFCQLKEETVISARDFLELVKTRILETNSLESVCGDCEWFTICKESKY